MSQQSEIQCRACLRLRTRFYFLQEVGKMAQETGLQDADMGKEEYISQLYALRAGLSVLSQEKDKAVALQDEAINDCETIKKEFVNKSNSVYVRILSDSSTPLHDYCRVDIKTGRACFKCFYTYQEFESAGRKARKVAVQKISAQEEEITRAKEPLNKPREELQRAETLLRNNPRSKVAQQITEHIGRCVVSCILLLALICVIFVTWLAVVCRVPMGSLTSMVSPVIEWLSGSGVLLNIIFGYLPPILVVAGIVYIVMLIRKCVEKRPYPYQYYENRVASARRALAIAEKEVAPKIKLAQSYVEDMRLAVRKAEWGVSHAKEYADQIKLIVDQANEKIAVIRERCDQMYIMLQRQFGKLLDPRDWKYVDLVIFNYETGRAFTRQEALQLVDRETQTDRIIASIDRAAKYIGDCVKTAAIMVTSAISNVSQQLGEMNRNMQGLASGMESVNTRIGALADVQARQLEAANAQNAQIAALVSETSLNNALLAKSNQTSQRLMEDVEYIRYYGTQY